MKHAIKLPGQILGLTLSVLFLILVLLGLYRRSDLMTSVAVGYGVSLFNMIASFFSLKWAFRKSNTIFFRTVVGGLFLRFAVIAGVLFGVWNFTRLDPIAFVVSMMLFYIIMQIFEIKFIYQELKVNR